MILVTEMMHDEGVKRLEDFPLRYEPDLYRKPQQLQRWLPEVEALIVRNQTQVNLDLLSKMPRLSVVGRLGVGLDNIDTKALEQRGIALLVPRGANASAVAEYVIGAMLAFSRQYEQMAMGTRAGRWERPMNVQGISGRHLRLVGYGATGKAVAERAEPFGLRVSVYDPYADQVPSRYRVKALEDGLESVDYLSLHVPQTPDTKGMVNAKLLGCLKPGAILINASRGELVNEKDLADAIKSGHLAGAILDVRGHEPPDREDRLSRLDKIWTTPHIAGLTDESQRTIAVWIAEGVKTALRERR